MTQAKFYDFDEKEEYYEEEEEVKQPRRPGDAPDGGWGWMVVLGAFLCSVLIEGLLFSVDALKDEIQHWFHVSESSLQSVGILMYSFSLLGGPLASGLVKRFNHRYVAMLGAFVVFAALLASTQMPNLSMLRLMYGVVAGIGIAMIIMPAITLVTVWFEHKRGITTGLMWMGSGAGVFIFGPLVKHLLINHDWRNALIIVAAIFLNCAVGGALFRSLTHSKAKGMKRGVIQRGAIMKALIAEKERQRTISNGSLDNCIITKDNKLIKIDKIDLRNKSNSYINRLKETFGFSSRSLNRSKNSLVVPKVVVDSSCRPRSPRASVKSVTPKPVATPQPTPKRDNGGGSDDSGCGSMENSPKLLPATNTTSYEALNRDDPWDTRDLVVTLPPKDSDAKASKCERQPSANANVVNTLNNLDTPGTSVSRPNNVEAMDPTILANNMSPAGSFRSVNNRVRTISNSTVLSSKYNSLCRSSGQEGSVMTMPTSVRSMDMSQIYESEPTHCKICYKLLKFLELELLKSPTFLLLISTSFLTMSGYVIPFVHLPKKAMEAGVDPAQADFLISVIWVANMMGRLVIGWTADRPWGNPIQLNNITLILAGFLSFFTPMYDDNGWFKFYAVFFGIFTAPFITLRSIIIVELFSKRQLVCAYGLVMFFMGLGALSGRYLACLLDGNMVFTMVGILLVAAGVLGIPLVRVKQWEARKDRQFEIVHIEELPAEQEMLRVENCESSI